MHLLNDCAARDTAVDILLGAVMNMFCDVLIPSLEMDGGRIHHSSSGEGHEARPEPELEGGRMPNC